MTSLHDNLGRLTERWRIGRRMFAAWIIVLGVCGNGLAALFILFSALSSFDIDPGALDDVLAGIAIALFGATHLALLALSAYRLRDAGRSAWWVLLALVVFAVAYWAPAVLLLLWVSALAASAFLPSRAREASDN